MKPLGKFPNRFLEEIAAQPEAMRRAARAIDEQTRALELIASTGSQRTLVFTGMGASYAACYAPVTVLAGRGIHATMVDTAELLHFRQPTLGPGVALVVVSQSGRSAEIVRLMEAVDARSGPFVISVTNGRENPLAARSAVSLDTRAGPEVGPSTLSWVASLVALAALSEVLAGRTAEDAVEAVRERTERAAAAAEVVLGQPERQAERFAEWLDERSITALLGRGTARAASEVGALVLKEAARMQAEALESAQFRHGPLELAGPALSAAVVATEPETAALDRGLASELARAGASVLLIERDAGGFVEGDSVAIGAVHRSLAACVAAIPFQLAAWHVATERGLRPGMLSIASKVTTRE